MIKNNKQDDVVNKTASVKDADKELLERPIALLSGKNLKNKMIFIIVIVLLANVLISGLCYFAVRKSEPLMPVLNSGLSWSLTSIADSTWGGKSSIEEHSTDHFIDYSYFLNRAIQDPSASVAMDFEHIDPPRSFIDLSEYSRISFSITCKPANTLIFIIETYDEGVSSVGVPLTYRKAITHVDCYESPSNVSVDLNTLLVPLWWLKEFKISLSNDHYALNKVLGFAFVNSVQSPLEVDSSVNITHLALHRTEWTFLPIGLLGLMAVWGLGFYWMKKTLRAAKAELVAQVAELAVDINERKTDFNPEKLVAEDGESKENDEYEEGDTNNSEELLPNQITLKSQRNKEADALMTLLMSDYANVNMSLDYAVSKLGINRNKVNAILKDKVGQTFGGYLIQVRLEAACQLLMIEGDAKIADIANRVGYSNVTSFNRAFKATYDCTPKAYKLNHSTPSVK